MSRARAARSFTAGCCDIKESAQRTREITRAGDARQLAERGYEGGVTDCLATFIRDKRQAGARGYADYLSCLTTALYRRWGAAFARANARVRITRLVACAGRSGFDFSFSARPKGVRGSGREDEKTQKMQGSPGARLSEPPRREKHSDLDHKIS